MPATSQWVAGMARSYKWHAAESLQSSSATCTSRAPS